MLFVLRATNKFFQEGIRETSTSRCFSIWLSHIVLLCSFFTFYWQIIYLDANSVRSTWKRQTKKISSNYAYRVTKKTDIIIPYNKYSTRENDSINFLTHTSFVTRLLNLTQSFEHNDRSRNFTISQEQGLCRNFLLSGYALALRN